jgi:hypothetical protein
MITKILKTTFLLSLLIIASYSACANGENNCQTCLDANDCQNCVSGYLVVSGGVC